MARGNSRGNVTSKITSAEGVPLWTISQLEGATHMKSSAVVEQIVAGTPILQIGRGDRPASGKGSVRLASFDTAIDLAGARALQMAGFPFAAGIEAMRGFTNEGDFRDSANLRLPGKPYPKGETIMLAIPNGPTAVVNTDDDRQTLSIGQAADAAGGAFPAWYRSARGLAVLNISQLYENVRSALGLDPDDYKPAPDETDQ